MPDNPNYNIIPKLKEACKTLNDIENKKEKIIVHCSAGASRSPTIIIGFLM